MKRIISAVIIPLLSVIAAIAGGYTLESLPNVQLQDEHHHVTNPDNVLSDDTEAAINSSLKALRDSTGIEFAVVAVKSIDTDDYNQFSIDLFNKWRLGEKGKNNGILFIIGIDDHKYYTRVGNGLEGVLPDAICNRVGTQVLVPYMKEDKTDEGIKATVDKYISLLTDPAALEEFKQAAADDGEIPIEDLLMIWAGIGLALLLIIIWVIYSNHKQQLRAGKTTEQIYQSFKGWGPVLGVAAVVGLGIPLLAIPLLKNKRRSIRYGKHSCPNCGTEMQLLDEETDNLYLNPSQDFEEKINSVDYDVWLCPNCNMQETLAYVNQASPHTECPNCQARAAVFQRDTVLQKATTRHEGRGQKSYLCKNCKHLFAIPYTIPRKSDDTFIVGGGGGFGGGTGGSSGGSWGGGFTSGGGAGGSW